VPLLLQMNPLLHVQLQTLNEFELQKMLHTRKFFLWPLVFSYLLTAAYHSTFVSICDL